MAITMIKKKNIQQNKPKYLQPRSTLFFIILCGRRDWCNKTFAYIHTFYNLLYNEDLLLFVLMEIQNSLTARNM